MLDESALAVSTSRARKVINKMIKKFL